MHLRQRCWQSRPRYGSFRWAGFNPSSPILVRDARDAGAYIKENFVLRATKATVLCFTVTGAEVITNVPNGRRVPTSRSATEGRCSWGCRVATVERMTIQRMEHVGVVVDDLAAATEFFVELGLELQGEGPVEGPRVDRVVGLDGVRAEIVVVQTPDSHGRLELTKFHTP